MESHPKPRGEALRTPGLAPVVAICLLITLCAPLLRAQDNALPDRPKIPVIGRPTNDFYNAAGTKVEVIAKADPTTVAADQWLTYTLTITNLIDPASVEKPSLKALKDFAGFQVREGSDLDPPIDPAKPRQRVFTYQLRPVDPVTRSIPALDFYYYDPRRIVDPTRPQDKFARTESNVVEFRVTAAKGVAAKGDTGPLEVPGFAEEMAGVRGGWCFSIPQSPRDQFTQNVVWLAPVSALLIVFIWRWFFPDAVKRARLQGNRAVRRVLVELDRMRIRAGTEDANVAWHALITYLRERQFLPEHAGTPDEVAKFLMSLDADPSAIEKMRKTLEQLDKVRFTNSRLEISLLEQATEAVIGLEESR